ncbi:MAG: hypothetical protein PHQ23_02820 [Candidatus Wallbacteria bacterium]|nr:hypothetical protein [Candidatus Wallbacteria bacterium]
MDRTRMRFFFSRRRGFTYIEALIILVIVGLGLVPLLDLLITSFKMNQAGYQYLQANLSSQEMLTILKNSPADRFREAKFSPVSLSPDDIGYNFHDEFGRFQPEGEIIVEQWDFDDVFKVSIKVSWLEKAKKKDNKVYYILSLSNNKFLKLGDL